MNFKAIVKSGVEVSIFFTSTFFPLFSCRVEHAQVKRIKINMCIFSCVHFYFLDSCSMELAMDVALSLHTCLNARFILYHSKQ